MSAISIFVGIIAAVILGVIVDWLLKSRLPKDPKLPHIIAGLVACVVLIVVAGWPSFSQSQPPLSTATPYNRELIKKISFDYLDSPAEHGWIILDNPSPTFKHIASGFVGDALEITSSDRQALDFPVSPATRFGTLIEFVVKLEEKAVVYANVEVQSKNKSTSQNVWYAFVPGTEQPKQTLTPPEEEWNVYVMPEQLGGEWLLFRIDIKEAVMDTIGNGGWELGQLMKFRLRGSLSIAYISVYE